jgi:hypothetical protein
MGPRRVREAYLVGLALLRTGKLVTGSLRAVFTVLEEGIASSERERD